MRNSKTGLWKTVFHRVKVNSFISFIIEEYCSERESGDMVGPMPRRLRPSPQPSVQVLQFLFRRFGIRRSGELVDHRLIFLFGQIGIAGSFVAIRDAEH